MNNYDALMALDKPCFVLLRNLPLDESGNLTRSAILAGDFEFVAHAENYEDVDRLVPEPRLPVQDGRIKWGVVQRLARSQRINAGECWSIDLFFSTSHHVMEEDVPDHEMFGESYTILWICSDVDSATAALVEKYKKFRSAGELEVWEFLPKLWGSYADHAYPLDPDARPLDNYEFNQKIRRSLDAALRQMEDGPSDAEWKDAEMHYF